MSDTRHTSMAGGEASTTKIWESWDGGLAYAPLICWFVFVVLFLSACCGVGLRRTKGDLGRTLKDLPRTCCNLPFAPFATHEGKAWSTMQKVYHALGGINALSVFFAGCIGSGVSTFEANSQLSTYCSSVLLPLGVIMFVLAMMTRWERLNMNQLTDSRGMLVVLQSFFLSPLFFSPLFSPLSVSVYLIKPAPSILSLDSWSLFTFKHCL